MTFTAISVIGLDISAAMDRTVSQSRLKCCQMAVTIYHGLTKLSPPTWQHHHLTIASTIVSIIQLWKIPTVSQYGKAHLRPDASLLRCTLPSPTTHVADQGLDRTSSVCVVGARAWKAGKTGGLDQTQRHMPRGCAG